MTVNRTVKVEFDDQEVERPWDSPLRSMNWSAFPQAYDLLLNERYQFPMDMAMARMKIDRTRQLFLDDFLIGHQAGLTRETHATKDHPDNPIFNPCKHYPCFICPDPEHGWRLYYNSAGYLLHVAFSQDGINWELPELNVFDLSSVRADRFPGGPNNVVAFGEIHGLFCEPDDPEAAQQYKAILHRPVPKPDETVQACKRMTWPYLRTPPDKGQTGGAYELFTSPDGFSWTFKAPTNHCCGPHPDLIAPYQLAVSGSDAFRARWDPKLNVYLANTKHRIGPDWRFSAIFDAARVVGMCESDDLIHWSAPRIYAYPDGEDAKIPGMHGIYEADGYPYESIWLNNFSMSTWIPMSREWIEEKKMPKNRPYKKRNWIRLATSRDGRHFYYFADRKPFISLGPEGSWKPHYLRMANLATIGGPVVKDDELWFYYRGGTIDGPKSGWHYATGLATLRRDGFASLNAEDEPGLVISRPLVFEGDGKLFVNADVGKDGYLQVSVMEEEGQPIEKFEQEDCQAISGDATKTAVGWRSNDTLAKFKDRYIRLAFHLKNAKLYSFWIE